MSEEDPTKPPLPSNVVDLAEKRRRREIEAAKQRTQRIADHLKAFFSGHLDAHLLPPENVLKKMWEPLIEYAETEKKKLNTSNFDAAQLAEAREYVSTLQLRDLIENVRSHMEGKKHYSDIMLYTLAERLITELKK